MHNNLDVHSKSRRCPGLAPTTRFSWAFIGADTWSYSISDVVITPDKLTPMHQLRGEVGSPGIEPGRCFPQTSSFERWQESNLHLHLQPTLGASHNNWYPSRDSNSDCTGLKPVASANWARGA